MASAASAPLGAHYFEIGELVAYIRDLFAADPVLNDVWVSGEIADVSHSAAGHVYFTVRDRDGRMSSVMFRSAFRRQTLPLVAGHQALVHGAVGIYPERSVYQLVADLVLPGDAGRLQAEFELMRRRLDAEGLFAPGRKRQLPRLPRRIGIVTSESGAVIHDMMTVWERRYRNMEIILAPAAVQGEAAASQIIGALRRLTAFHLDRRPLDLIILARGGGSPEELAVFNDERVARAIFASPIPIVTAIGHEVDKSIADLVADLRAPTPSAAAEMIVPDQAELCEEIRRGVDRAEASLRRAIATNRMQVAAARQHVDRFSPARLLAERRSAIDDLQLRASRAIAARLDRARSRVQACAEQLEALSPETTLQRGYAVCSRVEDGKVLTSAEQAAIGEQLAVRLAEGTLLGEVIGKAPTESKDRPENAYA